MVIRQDVGNRFPLPSGERVVAKRPGEGGYTPKPAKSTKTFARNMRKDPTKAEHLLWFELRNRNLNNYRFSRQVRIGSYIADFVCRKKKLIVELDGSQHVENPEDEVRSKRLIGQGYAILRFWNDEVLLERNAVLETILSALEGRLTPPHPTSTSAQLRFAVPAYPSPHAGEEKTGETK